MSNTADMGSYVSARDAALRARLHPDYIARLARHSKIRAKRVGRKWYVEEKALDAFLIDLSAGKEARRTAMKEKRKREYVRHTESESEKLSHVIEEKIAEKVTPRAHRTIVTSVKHANLIASPGINAHALSYAVHPSVDFLHRIVALVSALIIVFGAYGLFDREFGSAAVHAFAYSAGGTAAFASVFLGANPECDSAVQRLTAAASASVQNVLISLDNAMPSGLPESSFQSANGGCAQ